MKQATITVTGDGEAIGNLINLIVRNPKVQVSGLEVSDKQCNPVLRDTNGHVYQSQRPTPFSRWENDKRAVFVKSPESTRFVFDIDATLANLGLTLEGLQGRPWPRSSLEYALKKSISQRNNP